MMSRKKRRVYSHLRGKKSASASLFLPNMGTLPLAWEKGEEIRGKNYAFRITPTRVGKRSYFEVVITQMEVHSHVCGKKCESLQIIAIDKGTLPLAWKKAA